MTYSIGVDVSHYQGKMDWQKCAAAGVNFAIIRATVGNYIVDTRFAENWQGAGDVGIKRLAYHALAPSISVALQMKRFREVIGDREPDVIYINGKPHKKWALDCELTQNQSRDIITARIEGCVQAIINWGMERPIIYTRQSWWDVNVVSLPHWQSFPLWVANYTNALVPSLPRDWNSWFIWQYTSKGDGHKYGAESKSIDLNRMAMPLLGEPPPEPEPSEYPMQIRTTAYRLNVRNKPVIVPATHIGTVRRGTKFDAIGETPDGKWVMVETYVYKKFTEKL